MPDRPPFPIPEDLTPETFCLCIQIPNDPIWKTVISGLLFQPAEWFNWQRDEDRSGKILAQYWRNIYNDIDWSTMSCCCPEILYRVTEDGDLEVSTDGGLTYHPAGNSDPRATAPQLPPLTGDDGNEKRCTAANNVLGQFKDGIATFEGYFDTVSTITEFVFAAAGAICALILVGVAAIPVVVGIVLGLMRGIWNAGKTAYVAAFDDSIYGQLLCILYNNCPSDGIYTDSSFDAIRSDINSTFDTIARDAFTALLNGVSTQGLNTMARTQNFAPGTCDDCDGTAEVWVLNDNSGNYHQLMPVDGIYTLHSEWFTSGHYYANIAFTETPEPGCAVGNKCTFITQSGIDISAYNLQFRQGDCTSDPLANCYALKQLRSETPFDVTFSLVYSDPCFA